MAGKLFRADGLADGDVLGSRENLRRALQDVAGQAGVDHAGIFCVGVREEARCGQKNREEHSENGQTETGRPKTFQDANAHTLAPRGWSSIVSQVRSEERRVGKECRSRWSPYH